MTYSFAAAALATALAILGVTAYAQQSPPPSTPPTAGSPSDAQLAPGVWSVERVRCSDLLNADDDDRASAAMFYYGYVAAKAGIHRIDVNQIQDNIGKVMRRCSAAPTITVPEAFQQALAE